MLNKLKYFLIIFLPGFALAQEVEYINGSPGNSFPEYIQYLFNISFGLAGLGAFLMLIYAGFQYLSSAGSPERIKEAKKRILTSFLGLFLVIASYGLLITINPDIVMLIMPQLEEVEIISPPLEAKEIRLSLLGTVKEVGYIGGLLAEEIDDSSSFIFESILKCNCIFARGLCLCDGGSESSSCEPEMCYAGTDGGGHPCSNYDKIKEEMESILFRFKEIVYYQNRAVGSDFLKTNIIDEGIEVLEEGILDFDFSDLSLEGGLSRATGLGGEARSLQEDIDKVLMLRSKQYEAIIAVQTDERIINSLMETSSKITQEIELKEDLRDKLIEFAIIIEFLKKPIDDLTSLPEQCALNTQTQCEPKCIGECYDTYIGCHAICVGLNPCPFIEIGLAYGQIELVKDELIDSTEEIMGIIDEIRKLKGETL